MILKASGYILISAKLKRYFLLTFAGNFIKMVFFKYTNWQEIRRIEDNSK
jgi:hypothetical protein